MTKSKPIPLVVYLEDEIILGKTHSESTEMWQCPLDLKASFRGVTINVQRGIVTFFCGAEAIGEFEYSFVGYSGPLSKKDKLSIYRRFITALRMEIKPPRSQRTKKLVFGDHRRPSHNRCLSIWEMGHMLPCLKTSEYTNLGSGNRAKMFIF